MRILVIDDEAHIRKTTTVTLDALGHECMQASTGAEAVNFLQKGSFDAAFLDLRIGSDNGLDFIPKLLALEPKLSIVVFTAFSSIDTAVEAMRRGAVDYIAKPFTPEQIRQSLSRLENARRLENRVVELESLLSSTDLLTEFETKEPLVQKLFETATKAASSAATILLLGESGTGKSILARALHRNSPRRENAFVTVACPSLSRELLESELFGHVRGAFTGAVGETWGKVKAAEGGTLFLDEIGELPLEIQPKLLRLLQEREYERVGDAKPRKADVRVIAVTNRRLEDLVKEGKFREDLYYRLNVITIELPPLRLRPLDLHTLAIQHLKMFARQSSRSIKDFTPAAMSAMQRYSWPGNLRELRNVIERAVILSPGEKIDLNDFPDSLRGSAPSNVGIGHRITLDQLEREHIMRIIEIASSMDEAAQILGIDPATLYRKRKRYAEMAETSAAEPATASTA
ncbi:MAG: sigma-54 dependent transcriptional regulator [Methylacidiphilales bacterium]|nr:sigma-54 dependent transcriptional regulator [Candidatus Methylacidiphilales bacterium]